MISGRIACGIDTQSMPFARFCGRSSKRAAGADLFDA
jgi:hypothetical protein